MSKMCLINKTLNIYKCNFVKVNLCADSMREQLQKHNEKSSNINLITYNYKLII